MINVEYYSTQGSGSNTPATELVTLLYSRKSLLYSETHYSTQKVAGVTKISSWKEGQKWDNLVTVNGHLGTPTLLFRPPLRNWLVLCLYTTSNKAYMYIYLYKYLYNLNLFKSGSIGLEFKINVANIRCKFFLF